MSTKEELFLGVRKSNGQIGYLSEGVKIPEFFNLVIKKNEEKKVLIDFAPVIDELHHLHKKQNELTIRNEYNSVYNYWQDSKTYKKEIVRVQKNEVLCKSANDLINTLQARILEKSKELYADPINVAPYQEIKDDCNMVIDLLLCFIHSKAALEIESFKFDTLLGNYCSSIEDVLFRELKGLAGMSDDSLLKYIAFEKRDELSSFLSLLNPNQTEENFLLTVLDDSQNTRAYDDFHRAYKNYRQIEYPSYTGDFVQITFILRDLLCKFRSIKELLYLLKNEKVEWSESESLMTDLSE